MGILLSCASVGCSSRAARRPVAYAKAATSTAGPFLARAREVYDAQRAALPRSKGTRSALQWDAFNVLQTALGEGALEVFKEALTNSNFEASLDGGERAERVARLVLERELAGRVVAVQLDRLAQAAASACPDLHEPDVVKAVGKALACVASRETRGAQGSQMTQQALERELQNAKAVLRYARLTRDGSGATRRLVTLAREVTGGPGLADWAAAVAERADEDLDVLDQAADASPRGADAFLAAGVTYSRFLPFESTRDRVATWNPGLFKTVEFSTTIADHFSVGALLRQDDLSADTRSVMAALGYRRILFGFEQSSFRGTTGSPDTTVKAAPVGFRRDVTYETKGFRLMYAFSTGGQLGAVYYDIRVPAQTSPSFIDLRRRYQVFGFGIRLDALYSFLNRDAAVNYGCKVDFVCWGIDADAVIGPTVITPSTGSVPSYWGFGLMNRGRLAGLVRLPLGQSALSAGVDADLTFVTDGGGNGGTSKPAFPGLRYGPSLRVAAVW